VATAIVVVLALGADGPWRADHAFWAANQEAAAAAQAQKASPTIAAQDASAYLADIHTAMTLNPWEPTYPAAAGSDYTSVAAHAPPSVALQDLLQARKLFTTAVADEPLLGGEAENLAIVDVDLARFSRSSKHQYLAAAEAAARQALRDNPRDTAYQQLLATVTADVRTGATNA
jgi:hypothetical protein